MGKKSQPSQPDPIQTAALQAQANKEAVQESAKVNAINQTTPYGTVTYTRDANGVPTGVTTALTPAQQQVLDRQNELALQLTKSAQNQAQFLPTDKFDLSQFGAMPTVGDFQQQNDDTRKATYEQAMGLMRPEFEASNRRLETDVYNRGLPLAGEAATKLRDDEGRRQSSAEQQAAYQAVSAGNAEAANLYNRALQSRQQGISEYTQERQMPYQELATYMTGTPTFSAPNLPQQTQYQIAAPDVAGNIYQNYQTRSQIAANNLNGLYSLGGSAAQAAGMAAMASDRRVKKNIKKIGKTPGGFNLYEFEYVWGGPSRVGVMADEVEKVIPEAVMYHPHGYKMVDYGVIF